MSTQTPVEAPDLSPAREIIEDMSPVSHGDLIPLLQRIQDAYGYLPEDVIGEVSRMARIPVSRMYGVATFYAQFYLEPHGKHMIRLCRGTACHVRGGSKVIEAVQHKLGIQDGETTDDMMFSLETVACLGACALAPVMVVDEAYHGKVTAKSVEKVIDRIIEEES